jgi:hypothetical protein
MAAKSISIPVTGNTAPLRKSLTSAEKQIKRFAEQSKQEMKTAATAFGIVGAAVGGLATKFYLGAQEAERANRRVAQIAKSMGLFGAQTDNVTNRLLAYGDALERETGFTAESIKETQAKLLTFSELAKSANTVGSAFDRATKAAIDMAAAGFGEASSNAVQLGKALQDPIKGITALARSGISFNAQQKDQIRTLVESNEILKAQDLILAAIETQVGGTAEATATATDKMKNSLGEVTDIVGDALAPAFDAASDGLQSFAKYAQENQEVIVASAALLGGLAVAVTTVKVAMATATAVSAAYALAQTGLAAANIAVQVSTGVGIVTAIAATATIAVLTKKVYDNAKANRESAEAMTEAARAQSALRAIQLDKQGVVPAQLETLPDLYTKVGNAAESARDKERRKFKTLKDSLKSAKDALRQYVASISDAITKEVSLSQAFSNAASSQADAQDAVNSALRERSDAYEALNQAKATRDQNAYDEALRRVAAAEAAVTKAQDVKPKDYTAIFAEQIAAAKAFAGYVKQLVQNGLGKAGLAQILDLGPVAGAQVAKDLLGGTGGLTIAGLNADLAAVAAEGTAAGMAIPGVSEALGGQVRRGSSTYYIQVTAGIGDKNEIGRQVVEVLQQYEKRVGALPIKVKK